MYGKTAVVVVATVSCVASLTFSVFRTGVRADDMGQRVSRRLVSARPVVKPLNVHGPFLMTRRYGIDHFFDTRLIYDDYRHRFWVATLAKQKSKDSG